MRCFLLLVLLIAMAGLVGCGSDNPPTKPEVVVVISPSFPHVQVEQNQQFTATVTGTSNQTVTWAVMGGAGRGSIDTTGLYTAPVTVPDPSAVAIRAVSLADTSKSATVYAVITGPSVTVAVTPATTTVQLGQTQQFTATVTGTTNTSVTWSVEGGASGGTIDTSGLYTAPTAVPDPAKVTVRATSTADTLRSGTATVTVVDPVPAGFVVVPAGSFTMGDGSPESYCGSDEHPVTLTEDFYLGETEVTNQQYLILVQWAYDHGYVTATEASVVDAQGGTSQLLVLDPDKSEIAFANGTFTLHDAGHGINPDHPVKQVTWEGAAAYCDWLSLKEGLPAAYDHQTWRCNGEDPYRAQGYRLPTDAEWEYAAQYDDERIYPWGNQPPTCDLTNYTPCGVSWTVPVASKLPEKVIASRGLYDMAGNLWEWCNDLFNCTPPLARTDPVSLYGTFHVLRGGSWWATYSPRCSYRYYYDPAMPWAPFLDRVGFRVARTVDP